MTKQDYKELSAEIICLAANRISKPQGKRVCLETLSTQDDSGKLVEIRVEVYHESGRGFNVMYTYEGRGSYGFFANRDNKRDAEKTIRRIKRGLESGSLVLECKNIKEPSPEIIT